ncbi:MAG: queuosine salvage family protein [Anaerolineales bacterium]|nr:queuosine salvage family protein [Anaerolineales bacterium]
MTPFKKILSARPDPLNILATTAFVVQHARAVKIDSDAIARAADALAQTRVAPPAWNFEYHFFDGTERTVNYLFLLDALNFCFWGKPKWGIEYKQSVIASRAAPKQSPSDSEIASARKPRLAMTKRLDGYWALAASLKRALEKNPRFADADSLARLAPRDLARVLRGNTTIPLFTERWRNARELGAILCEHWGGSAATFVADARRDAPRLAQMIADNFASFNDIAVYENREVRFFKRAQILVADLWGAFGGKAWGAFDNLDALTAFADYKLPQILRAWEILKYAPALARKIDAQIELEANSPVEIEIRAATLWAVEFLRDALARRDRKLWSIQVDWILWEASQARFVGMKPYQRVRTIYY